MVALATRHTCPTIPLYPASSMIPGQSHAATRMLWCPGQDIPVRGMTAELVFQLRLQSVDVRSFLPSSQFSNLRLFTSLRVAAGSLLTFHE
jgi:hypothetical protein